MDVGAHGGVAFLVHRNLEVGVHRGFFDGDAIAVDDEEANFGSVFTILHSVDDVFFIVGIDADVAQGEIDCGCNPDHRGEKEEDESVGHTEEVALEHKQIVEPAHCGD